MALQGLKSQSISTYLSVLRYLQVSAIHNAPQRALQVSAVHNVPQGANWPRLQYVLKGIARSQPGGRRQRLSVTARIMHQILTTSRVVFQDPFKARLLWAACCLGYFGFMRTGKFIATGSSSPVIQANDLAVDSHSSPVSSESH